MKNQNNNGSSTTHSGYSNGTYTIPDYGNCWSTATNFRVYQVPEAYITVNHHRRKIYDDKVYLKNNTNFELEFFNGETETIYVEININGETEKERLIVKPGQRVFLERFLSTDKKFNFQTYEVEKGNEKVDNAIRNNGIINLTYYVEDTSPLTWITTPHMYTGTTGNVVTSWNTDNFTLTTSNSNLVNTLTGGRGVNAVEDGATYLANVETKESGKIEKGENSNQNLISENLGIRMKAIGYGYFKLMPESEQLNQKEYCTSCGVKKRKSSWKFCPSCGNAY